MQFDSVLEIEYPSVRSHRLIAAYSHWFNAVDKTARLDLILPFEDARRSGLLSGAPDSTSRQASSDPWARISVNALGSPPLEPRAFMEDGAGHSTNTVAGVTLGTILQLGQCDDQRLLNLGRNRLVFLPQTGVMHTRGSQSYESTGSAYFYTGNTDFFGGNKFSQDPIFALQGHFVHTFPDRRHTLSASESSRPTGCSTWRSFASCGSAIVRGSG